MGALAEHANDFYNELSRQPNDRYRSWEHCYEVFNNGTADVDYLSLHLAFYLASWGMYRGKAFLLQRDYKIHHEAVKMITDRKYAALRGITSRELIDNVDLVYELYNRLKAYYESVRSTVRETKGKTAKADVSQTLITKILMGTLGCCPAYDRYFIRGIGELGFCKSFSADALTELAEFYAKNATSFDKAARKTEHGLAYPQMKILDMAFWKYGYTIENHGKCVIT